MNLAVGWWTTNTSWTWTLWDSPGPVGAVASGPISEQTSNTRTFHGSGASLTVTESSLPSFSPIPSCSPFSSALSTSLSLPSWGPLHPPFPSLRALEAGGCKCGHPIGQKPRKEEKGGDAARRTDRQRADIDPYGTGRESAARRGGLLFLPRLLGVFASWSGSLGGQIGHQRIGLILKFRYFVAYSPSWKGHFSEIVTFLLR